MKVLLVSAHPLPDSLNAHLAALADSQLRAAGHDVDRFDLYAEQFPPVLTAEERLSYYGNAQAHPSDMTQRLQRAEALVLVFPTWWFSMPAILKGWFDRVWAPGIAFDHGTPIKPLLTSLRHCIAITTLGSPWWVDWLVLWRPVARVLRRGILLSCAPKARFQMLSLYEAESVTSERLQAFEAKLGEILKRLGR